MRVVIQGYISHGLHALLKLTGGTTTHTRALILLRKQKPHTKSTTTELVVSLKRITSIAHNRPKSVRMQTMMFDLLRVICVSSARLKTLLLLFSTLSIMHENYVYYDILEIVL